MDLLDRKGVESEASHTENATPWSTSDDGDHLDGPTPSMQAYDPQRPNAIPSKRPRRPLLRVNTSSSKNSDGKKVVEAKGRSQSEDHSDNKVENNENAVLDYLNKSAEGALGDAEPKTASDGGSDLDYDIRNFVRASDLRPLFNKVRVKQRLLSAMLLLSHWHCLTQPKILEAGGHAQEALRLARNLHVEPALQARCKFYLAFAQFLENKVEIGLVPSRKDGKRAASINSMESERDEKSSLFFFEQACAAVPPYEEGKWAAEWAEHLKSMQEISPSVRERVPDATGSWINWIWSAVGRKKPASPVTILSREEGGHITIKPRPMEARFGRQQLGLSGRISKRQGGSVSTGDSNVFSRASDGNKQTRGDQIPDFTTWGSGDVDSPGSVRSFGPDGDRSSLNDDYREKYMPERALGDNVHINDLRSSSSATSSLSSPKRPPRASEFFVTNPDPPSVSSTGGSSGAQPSSGETVTHITEESNPKPEVKLEEKNPSDRSGRHSRARSVIFSPDVTKLFELEKKSSSAPSSPQKSLHERRRKSSIIARLTGRGRPQTVEELAEEGQSPYRATFDGGAKSTGVGGWENARGLKQRKGSGEDARMGYDIV